MSYEYSSKSWKFMNKKWSFQKRRKKKIMNPLDVSECLHCEKDAAWHLNHYYGFRGPFCQDHYEMVRHVRKRNKYVPADPLGYAYMKMQLASGKKADIGE